MEDEATDDYLDQCMKDWADLANEYAVSLFRFFRINNFIQRKLNQRYAINHEINTESHTSKTFKKMFDLTNL